MNSKDLLKKIRKLNKSPVQLKQCSRIRQAARKQTQDMQLCIFGETSSCKICTLGAHFWLGETVVSEGSQNQSSTLTPKASLCEGLSSKDFMMISYLRLRTSDINWARLCHRHRCGDVRHDRHGTPPTIHAETCSLKNKDLK